MIDHDAWLVFVGGVIGVGSSVAVLVLQRRWTVIDRRNAVDRESLDLAMRQLMAWQAAALAALSGADPDPDAEKRRGELDLHWEADPRLIPDREAATELLQRCKAVLLAPRHGAERADGMAELVQITQLGDRVLNAARDRRRGLA